jgi:cytochrome c oxidase cbb3-type subunit 4
LRSVEHRSAALIGWSGATIADPQPGEHDVEMTIYLLILIAAFVGILVWVFGRKRKARFDQDAKLPFNGDKR